MSGTYEDATPYDEASPPYRPAAVISPARPRARWLTVSACVAGAVGVALAVTALTLFLSYKNSATIQIHQMRAALHAVQAQEARNYSGLSGTISTLLTRYGTICSQDLTGPNGPAQFWFPCTNQRPG